MCTVVLRLAPDAAPAAGDIPLLLLGVRDEFTGRPWRPPARHWAGSRLTGGIDEQAGGTWLAVHPDEPRVACLLNGRGTPALPENRRSRGELPLRAAAEGAAALKDLADAPDDLAVYDPFHLVVADTAGALLLSWDGSAPALAALPPGTHVLTNAGHSFPEPGLTAPVASGAPGRFSGTAEGPDAAAKAAHFGPEFAAAAADERRWLALADGDGLPPDDPRALIVGHTLPDGRTWGTTSQTLVALAPEGVRYRFRAMPGEWYEVTL